MIDWRSVDPNLLKQPFRDDVDRLLKFSSYAWTVTYGFRSLEEQAVLWAKYQAGGPKAAPPGKSAHNFGLAIDLALDGSQDFGLQPQWDTSAPGWQWLFEAVFQHPRLHSGRDFQDSDHVEALGWKSLV